MDIYRSDLYHAWKKLGYNAPIDFPVDISVIFIDPCSPDLDNCLTALYRALDGKTWDPKPTVMTDDGLIQRVEMLKFYPNGPGKADNRIP